MQPATEFRGQSRVHRPRPLHAALAAERSCDQQHRVMSLPFRAGAGMADMARGVVMNFDPAGCKARPKETLDAFGPGLHRAHIGRFAPTAKPALPTRGRSPHNQRMEPRRSRIKAFAPDPDAPGRGCDVLGCEAAGEYRAPRSRLALREWRWFCLEHVRAYNAAWDYYRGMSPGEIEAELRSDIAWQRPTWPLGRLGGNDWRNAAGLEESLTAFADAASRPSAAKAAPAELKVHLAALELGWPVTLEAVKARYKELAKRHHPDANGGDADAGERFKAISLAYATLRTRLARTPSPAAG